MTTIILLVVPACVVWATVELCTTLRRHRRWLERTEVVAVGSDPIVREADGKLDITRTGLGRHIQSRYGTSAKVWCMLGADIQGGYLSWATAEGKDQYGRVHRLRIPGKGVEGEKP